METVPLTDVKAKFSHYVDQVADQQDRVLVTRNGKPAAVLVNPDDLESLEETLEILSDRELMAKINEGRGDIAAGRVFSLDEVKKDIQQE